MLLQAQMRTWAPRVGAKPFSCPPLSRVARPRSAAKSIATRGLYAEDRASAVHIELNKEIRFTRGLTDLEILYQTRAADMNAVNVATFWIQLTIVATDAKRTMQCQQLARRVLGKTLAFTPVMELRQLANVLYSMGERAHASTLWFTGGTHACVVSLFTPMRPVLHEGLGRP